MDNKIIIAACAGILGLLLALLVDWISLKGTAKIKPLIGVLFIALHVLAVYICLRYTEHFEIYYVLFIIGWILLPIFTFLLFYSLFIESSPRKIYLVKGVPEKLVTTGTYALTRHPEFLWYVLVLISLIFVSGSKSLLIVTPIWIFGKLVCVIVQDKILFEKMFQEYHRYKQQTPMLFPNRRSILACIRTLRVNTDQKVEI